MSRDPSQPVDSPSQRPSLWAPSAPPFGSTWTDFTQWVDWLDRAYELQLSKCWLLHEGLVHSLSALWHPWRSVYAAPIGSSGVPPAHGGPSQWHTSHLYPLRDRLQRPDGAPGSGCRNRDHRDYQAHLVGQSISEPPADLARCVTMTPPLSDGRACRTVRDLYAEAPPPLAARSGD